VSWEDVLMLAVLILSTLVARSIVVFGLMPLLGMARLAESIGTAYGAVIVWGGLRGAVSLALGLAVAENQALPAEFRHIVAVLTTGFVLFTLLVNGISLRPLVKLLGLDKLPPAEQALRDRALNLALARIKDKVSEVAAADRLAPQPVAAAMEEYDRRIAEAKADPEMANIALSKSELVAVGLRIMANREGELALDKLEAGILPRSIADSLIQGAGRLGDAAKVGGLAGYEQAAKAAVGFGVVFRIARWLHQHFRIERLLAVGAGRDEVLVGLRGRLALLVVLHEQAQALFVFLQAGLLLLHGLDVRGNLITQFLEVRGLLGGVRRGRCSGRIHGDVRGADTT